MPLFKKDHLILSNFQSVLKVKFFSLWIKAFRPKTFSAAISPVIIGFAYAFHDKTTHYLSFVLCLLVALFLQIATNLTNDYYDFKIGTDNKNRLGPLRITQSGLVSQRQIKFSFILFFSLSFVLGIYLVYRGGFVLGILGVLSILSGYYYTAGSKPFAYLGLGDILVFIFFGVVATVGTYYLQTLTLNPKIFIASFAPGFLSVAILCANNLRDRVNDKVYQKKTLAVRFGKKFSQIEYLISVFIATLVPAILFLFYQAPKGVFLSDLFLLFSFSSVKLLLKYKDDMDLNPLLGQTGKLLFLYSFLFSFGLNLNFFFEK